MIDGQLFHACRTLLKDGLSNARSGYLKAGKALLVIKDKKLWKGDGAHNTRFDQWLSNEMGIKKTTAYNLMAVYEKFGELIEFNDLYNWLEFSHIVALLPYVKKDTTDEEKERLLSLVNGQTAQGVRDNLRELSGKVPSDKCEHKETKTLQACIKCGKILK